MSRKYLQNGQCCCNQSCHPCSCDPAGQKETTVLSDGNKPAAEYCARETIPATDLLPEQQATIVTIQGDSRIRRRLTDLGLTPGTGIRVSRKAPMDGPVEVVVRRTKLSIDYSIAKKICVKSPGARGL